MKNYLFNFEKLELYQRSLDFTNEMFKITKKFPNEEIFGLSNQLRRAAMSIPLNLAEGFNNYYKKEKKRYFRIAKGSVHECVPGLTISNKQNYINRKEFDDLYKECFELSRRISGLIKHVENR
jgi:four helix bundle protein